MATSQFPTATNGDQLGLSQSHRHRYAGFDDETFSLYSNGSSTQAKRALEAHLAETERRLQEASQLGSSLLHQRTELSSKLKEVQEREDDDDIGPELRQKLVELEREFNEVGREAARAFIPRSRVPSNESAANGEPAVLETGGRESPSKPQPPSLSGRKQRNATPSRMNDIKLATEISSSLLNQIRELQAAYAEKDDALRAALSNQSSLETEREGLFQRLRSLDESEQRYKDENWTLETKLQELTSVTKESSDREQKLQQSIKAAQFERANMEKEYEELKQAHGRLNDDHVLARKHHDAELVTLKKDASLGESDRAALQKRIDDLSTQNQELAQAMAYKFRSQDPAAGRELTPEQDEVEGDGITTPDHSPPPSPTKGTPRHGVLESETLKSSLSHAHRMIQNLKNNIHREKTEKLELRRMLSATQDELEQRRTETGANAGKKSKKGKDDSKEFKKPARPDRLGSTREVTREILTDEEWEDHDGVDSPSRAAARNASSRNAQMDTDAFETANEHDGSSDFETATEHERETESEAFHTGAESLESDSSGDQTETEGKDRSVVQRVVSKKGHDRTQSFQSTASTDDEFSTVRTPVQQSQSQKFKIRYNRPLLRNKSSRSSQATSENTAGYKDSPSSVVSAGSNPSTPQGPSLFAELGDLSGSEDEDGTPGRSVGTDSRNITPQRLRKTPTQRAERGHEADPDAHKGLLDRSKDILGAAIASGLGFNLARKTSADESSTPSTPVAAAAPAFTAEPSSGEGPQGSGTVDNSHVLALLTPPELASTDSTERTMPAAVASLSMSGIQTQETEPVEVVARPLLVQAPSLQTSAIASQDTIPTTPTQRQAISAVVAQVPLLAASAIYAQNTEPEAVPRVQQVQRALNPSVIASQHTEPVKPAEPRPHAASLALSKVVQQYEHEPVAMVVPKQQSTRAAAGDAVVDQDPVRTSATPIINVQPTGPSSEPARPVTPVGNERPPTASRIGDASPDAVPPIPPRSPRARSFMKAQEETQAVAVEPGPTARQSSETSRTGIFGMLGFGKSKPAQQTKIAEDETSTVTSQSSEPFGSSNERDLATVSGADNTRTPFAEIEPNALPKQAKNAEATTTTGKAHSRVETTDEGTQTADFSDDMNPSTAQRNGYHDNVFAPGPAVMLGSSSNSRVAGVYRPSSSPNKSRESVVAPPGALLPGVLPKSPRRPGSSGSVRSRVVTPPPLPADHREAIAAAARGAPPVPAANTAGVMGPPLMPASAYRSSSQYRAPNTGTGRVYGTVRTSIHGVPSGSALSSPVTRRSSVSSFASEIDQRFNIHENRDLVFDPAVDPRMIQAITQTMIGEFLWKYTRKPGRETVSSTRHRRYFWVHPYTRTLYWSEQNPATAGRAQHKAKSVKIQSVGVISDDNPLPPGLHRKSLVVRTPGREIQFTAATSSRHEMWFNALSYLLLRSEGERSSATTGDANDLTAEDIDEFNAGFGRGRGNSRRSRTSVASYSTRASRAPHPDHPTLTPNDRPISRRSGTVRRGISPAAMGNTAGNRASMSSRLSTLAGSLINGSISSRHSLRSDGATTVGDATTLHADGGSSIYAGSLVRSSHDSAEDLRQVMERQDRDADHLENVRACCDGKHDVGSLSHRGSHRHSTLTVGRSSRRLGSVNGRTTPQSMAGVAGPSTG